MQPDQWLASVAVVHAAGTAPDGGSALELQASYSGAGWQDAGASVTPVLIADWSAYSTISLEIYVPAEMKGGLAKLYIKAGAESIWFESGDFPLTPGVWTPLQIDLTQLFTYPEKAPISDLTQIKEMGVKIGTSESSFTGSLYIDAIMLSAAPAALVTSLPIKVARAEYINVRTGPGTDHNIAGVLRSTETVNAYGRNQTGDWLLISPPENEEAGRWVAAALVNVDGNVASLPVVERGNEAVTDAGCAVSAAGQGGALLYGFEGGNRAGWVRQVTWSAGQSVSSVPGTATEGQWGLALQVSYSGGGNWTEAGAFVTPLCQSDWSSYTTLALDVYAPAELTGAIAQVYIKSGPDWIWVQAQNISLNSNGWTSIAVDLSSLQATLSQVNELGIKIGTSESAFEGSLYVDNVRLQ